MMIELKIANKETDFEAGTDAQGPYIRNGYTSQQTVRLDQESARALHDWLGRWLKENPVKKEGIGRMTEFEKELSALINKHSCENASNTPDYVLAQYLDSCLLAFDTAVQQRETHYKRDSRPSGPGPRVVDSA